MKLARLGARILGVLAACILCAGASAQDAKPRRRKAPPVEIVNIDLGWGSGMLSGERWQPATVWVTSQDKAFSGVLTLECQQDNTQNAVMFVGPVATTPGQITPVEVVFSPSFNARELVFTLAGRGYSTRVRYAREPKGNEPRLPRIGLAQTGHIVFVGDISAQKALDLKQLNITPANSPAYYQPQQQQQAPTAAQMWDNMFPAVVPKASRLPISWAAYESADMLVCEARDLASVDPRIKLALGTWVHAGGRLVIRADHIGPAWPDFLADTPAPITATEQQVFALSPEVKTLVASNSAASRHQARALRLTPQGERLGWKTLYPASRDGEDTPAGHLVAYGPVGLGMVTVVGFEPREVAALINDEDIKHVWRAVMTPTLPPRARLGGLGQQYMFGWGSEVAEMETRGAINSALDSMTVAPPIGNGVFWAIASCMVVLALMVGPFDAKFLKRRRLSRYSWATALLWIVIAGGGAILVPRIMRSGQSVTTRLAFNDTICDKAGQPLRTAAFGLTGVFAGKPITIEPQGSRAGAWSRGISAAAGWGDNPIISLPDLALPIQSDDQGAALRTAWPQEVDVPQWSLRTLSDLSPLQEPLPTDVGARVEKANGLFEVTVTNLPAESGIREAWLGIGDKWYDLGRDGGALSANGRDRTFRLAADNPTTRARDWNRAIHTTPNYWQPANGTPASLPWVRERGQAVDMMLASGRWACVCVRVDGLTPDVTVHGVKDMPTKQSTMLRLLTPLEDQE